LLREFQFKVFWFFYYFLWVKLIFTPFYFSYSCNSSVSGCYNCIRDYSDSSSIIGGCFNKICYYSNNSSIIGGENNQICGWDAGYAPPFYFGSCNSSIIGGRDNRILRSSRYSSVIGGCCNKVFGYCGSGLNSIVGGADTIQTKNNFPLSVDCL
jgi:hypothetical protein